MSEQEESDPVVREIPVYVSQKLSDQLYLFQYPIRPSSFPYPPNSIFASRIKPVQGRIELSVALDTTSSDYDRSKGEQIALNVDGTNSSVNEKDFPNGMMDKQLLSSSRAVNDSSRYAIGLIHEGKLHLTPIKDILVLRPDLTYLDKSDKTAKSEGRAVLHPDDPDLEEAMEEEAKQVTVKFAKTDSETLKKNRENSYNYHKTKEDMERWIPIKYNPHNTDESKAEFDKLYCDNLERTVLEKSDEGKYLDSLKSI
ncbi:DNA-directed RNA polymerase III subunit RPC5 [Lepeophtheirus salmonis]|uniref:Polymerase (RNA) III (DNA directed) polypeptide E [Danio rerio] n=1 Tax=Lepeophtheirus salmonis TaxID=72036 RepID=A0A0K2T4W6_LEPSM|nr:DNA-directed RNA polymerase III subunit RPC5-like [Lepeophtheirus salmonis]